MSFSMRNKSDWLFIPDCFRNRTMLCLIEDSSFTATPLTTYHLLIDLPLSNPSHIV